MNPVEIKFYDLSKSEGEVTERSASRIYSLIPDKQYFLGAPSKTNKPDIPLPRNVGLPLLHGRLRVDPVHPNAVQYENWNGFVPEVDSSYSKDEKQQLIDSGKTTTLHARDRLFFRNGFEGERARVCLIEIVESFED